MKGHRPSSLPVARYCGLAPRLAREWPSAGRSAFLSTIFHAHCAGNADSVKPMWDGLTPEEQLEIKSWKRPTDVQPERGPLLKYSDAHKELPLGIDEWGEAVDREAPECLTGGTLDFCWVVTARDGTVVVFVADIKRTRFTALDGPRSLQLLAYCWMAAAKFGAHAYCPGLWIAEDGEWKWDNHITRLNSKEAMADWRAVVAAATNKGEAVTGSHCSNCYSRTHCPEYVVPPGNETALAPALEQRLTEDNALGALVELERLEALCKAARDNLKEATVHNGLRILSEDGTKRWAATVCKGRVSFDKKAARKMLGEERYNECVSRGPEYTQHRWMNS